MFNNLHWKYLGIKYGFNINSFKKFVRETETWTNDRMREYHNEHLCDLINHAYHNVPFYRQLFEKNGLLPDDIKTVDDLYKLPIIRKQDIINNFDLFKANNMAKFHPVLHHTGGTTGTPMNYYNDRKSWALNWALKMRTFELAGFSYGKDKLAVMAGGSLIPGKNSGLKHKIWRILNNYYSMPITHLDNDIMKIYADELIRQKIKFMRGYPSAIATFAEYLISAGRQIPLKAIFTTAETLFDFQREKIRAAFLCEVYNTYGCGDGMGNATDCELHKGMHVRQEVSIMQIVDKDGNEVKPGEEGEIVLTSLYDYAMPFIRYAPGDYAIKGDLECACGMKVQTLKELIGRSSDNMKFSNGRILNAFSFPFEGLTSEIAQFQISQEERDKVFLYIVPNNKISDKQLNDFKELLEYHCGEGVVVEIKIVDKIEVPRSGKKRFVVSKVPFN